ncbi:hypothetical protein VXG46_002028 [Acinetobacter baumannii]|jgi:hypothetical protein|uniref:Uncharacterized protein n=2 Tax=Acinetobacter baumannii TaxID=470 RepID=A0A1S2G250_ACIBA|nr:hypothetical protein [Acinetobacter baumannii]EHU1307476.1 hypothetical protein [Acinetobacter baumannii]EHU1429266.1 hypothetical protein [Acinetobacter baumannii]EHU2160512.1 hypothetical protein [Acinetobacter baumannii]EHU2441235.1 hypothetical protein [Acinetobacter baumannii]EHU3348586.1 hypothetical protein [Acinetobacter baumannii]
MGNQPITKNIPPNSKAWEGYPSKVESCNVPKPFCYFQFDRPIAMPYTFMMSAQQWEYVERRNKLEFLLAVRFGMEYDIAKLNEDVLLSTGFHTGMYVKFQNYLRKHYQKDAAVLMAVFQSNAFTTRFGTSFAIEDLVGLKGAIDDLRVDDIMTGAHMISRRNGHGTQINRKMYQQNFNQDYNPTMLKTLAAQGLYPDEIEGIF